MFVMYIYICMYVFLVINQTHLYPPSPSSRNWAAEHQEGLFGQILVNHRGLATLAMADNDRIGPPSDVKRWLVKRLLVYKP